MTKRKQEGTYNNQRGAKVARKDPFVSSVISGNTDLSVKLFFDSGKDLALMNLKNGNRDLFEKGCIYLSNQLQFVLSKYEFKEIHSDLISSFSSLLLDVKSDSLIDIISSNINKDVFALSPSPDLDNLLDCLNHMKSSMPEQAIISLLEKLNTDVVTNDISEEITTGLIFTLQRYPYEATEALTPYSDFIYEKLPADKYSKIFNCYDQKYLHNHFPDLLLPQDKEAVDILSGVKSIEELKCRLEETSETLTNFKNKDPELVRLNTQWCMTELMELLIEGGKEIAKWFHQHPYCDEIYAKIKPENLVYLTAVFSELCCDEENTSPNSYGTPIGVVHEQDPNCNEF